MSSRQWRRGLIASLLCALSATTGAQPQAIGGDFNLTAADGSAFASQQLRGKIVVLAFGYTHCPDICPTTLTQMARLASGLGPQSGEVELLFVTLDPQRDTAAQLRAYVQHFHPRLRGLTGSSAAISKVAAQYGVRFEIYRRGPEVTAYTVDHSTDLYVLDRQGQLAAIVPLGTPEQRLLKLVRELLAAPG